MDNLITTYNSYEYIVQGENDNGNLLYLKSTSLNDYGKILLRTPDNQFNILLPNDNRYITQSSNYKYVVNSGPLIGSYSYDTSIIFNYGKDVTISVNKNIKETLSDTHLFTASQNLETLLGTITNVQNIFTKDANAWQSVEAFSPLVANQLLISSTGRIDSTGKSEEDGYMGLYKETITNKTGIGLSNNVLGGFIVRLDGSINTGGLKGVGFQFTSKDVVSIERFYIGESPLRKGLPMRYSLFARQKNYWIELFNIQDGHLYKNRNIIHQTALKGVGSTTFVLLIETIHIRESDYFSIDWANINEVAGYSFNCDIPYIEIYISDDVIFDNNISLNNKSILNANNITANKLILNGIPYTSIISDATLFNRLTDIFMQFTTINVFASLWQPSLVLPSQNPLEDEVLPEEFLYLIPFMQYNHNTAIIKYRENVNITPIVGLNNIINNEGVVFIRNKTLFSSLSLDALQIDILDTTKTSVREIELDSNVIIWNKNIHELQHGIDKIPIQDGIANILNKYPPDLLDVVTCNFQLIYEYDEADNTKVIGKYSEYKYVYSDDYKTEYIIRASVQPQSIDQTIELNYSKAASADFINAKNAYLDRFFYNSMYIFTDQSKYFKGDHIGIYKIDGELIDTEVETILKLTIGDTEINYADFLEYEFNEDFVAKYISFRIHKTNNSYPPGRCKLLGKKGNKWELILDIQDYPKRYNIDINLLIDCKSSYKVYRFIVESLFIDKDILNVQEKRFEFSNLRLYGYKLNILGGNTVKTLTNIELFKIDSTLHVNNTVDIYDLNNITSLIVNNDFFNVSGHNTYSTVHINTFNDDINIKNNVLRLGLLTSYENLHNTVIHSISRDIYDRTNYHIDVSKNFRDFDKSSISTLSLTKEKVGINIQPIEDGLNIHPALYLYNTTNDCVGLSVTNDTSNYTIYLPKNIPDREYLLKVDSVNDCNVYTSWFEFANEFFKNKNLFFGIDGINHNLFDIYSSNEVYNATKENVVHIRKLVIGQTESIPQNNIYDNSLLNIMEDHSVVVVGSLYSTKDIQTDSDIRYKENLKIIENPIEKIKELGGYTFERNDVNMNRRFTGLIAQEVQKVLPEAVLQKHDGSLRILYGNLAGLFIEAIKDLQSQIDDIKEKLY